MESKKRVITVKHISNTGKNNNVLRFEVLKQLLRTIPQIDTNGVNSMELVKKIFQAPFIRELYTNKHGSIKRTRFYFQQLVDLQKSIYYREKISPILLQLNVEKTLVDSYTKFGKDCLKNDPLAELEDDRVSDLTSNLNQDPGPKSLSSAGNTFSGLIHRDSDPFEISGFPSSAANSEALDIFQLSDLDNENEIEKHGTGEGHDLLDGALDDQSHGRGSSVVLGEHEELMGESSDSLEDFKSLDDSIAEGRRIVESDREFETSEAAVLLEHVLVVATTVKIYEKTCGQTDLNHFTVEKFLKAIKAKTKSNPDAVSSQRQYDAEKMHLVLRKARGEHSGFAREPLINLLGAITIRGPLDINLGTSTSKNKKPKRASAKARFDVKNPIHHEVVNSMIRGSQEKSDKTLKQSAIKAQQLKDICHKKHKSDISLVDYGLYGYGHEKQVGTPEEFLRHVFDAAVTTRDGYAEVTFPASKTQTIPKKSAKISNCETSIRAAKPPQTATSDSYDLHRFQQIISFNSGTLKNFLKSKNQPDTKNSVQKTGQDGYLSQTDDYGETPAASGLTSRRK